MKPLTLVFMGTPDLAATVLRHVLLWPGGRVVAAYCQPDRPAGRGMALKEPPVKVLAREHGIPVEQPLNFKNDEAVATLRTYAPDYLIVAAYGLILPQRVLDIPHKCALNVHTSLLPKYRGAAPIQRAVINGETATGVTIMQMDAGMDTGPVLLQQSVPITERTTAGTLHDTLAEEGGALLLQALEGLETGRVIPRDQDHAAATYAPKLNKADGEIDFARSATEVSALVRGVTPWPGATAVLERPGEVPLPVTVCEGSVLPDNSNAALSPDFTGEIFSALIDKHLIVRCGGGTVYAISSLRPAGKKAMDAASFFNGYLKGREGARFTAPQTAKTIAEKA